MAIDIGTIDAWLSQKENEHIEFKAASNSFDFDKLAQYCCALANEGGGSIVFGIDDMIPRKVVGSNAFADIENVKLRLFDGFYRMLKVSVEEFQHPEGRIVVFTVRERPKGTALNYKGVHYMRVGESLTHMSYEMLRIIHEESAPDFSALICDQATINDLDDTAIRNFREAWAKKSKNANLLTLSKEQLLSDAELIRDSQISYAALLLLGTNNALKRYLPNAEIVFEYRTDNSSISYQERREFKTGYLLYQDELWETINKRNELQHYEDAFHFWNIETFDESTVREAIQNAVVHRDYRQQSSVFIRQCQTTLDVKSPGGFPPGISPSNLLWQQYPRNRRLAEALQKCGLIERSGQGIDRMYSQSIKQGKKLPDYSKSSAAEVQLLLEGAIQDPQFIRFLEQVAKEKQISFSIEDLLLLDCIHNSREIPDQIKNLVNKHLDHGIIEKATGTRGRGLKYILSVKFYKFIGKQGAYTRKKGLSMGQNKLLLLAHIERNRSATMSELEQVVPNLTKRQVSTLLNKLKEEGRISLIGQKRGSRWQLNE